MDHKTNNIIHIVIAILVLYICYVLFIRIFSNDQEGFTGDNKGKASNSNSNSNTVSGSSNSGSNGIASNSASYSSVIKNYNTKLSDKLMTSKYKSDYEDVIVNMEDLVNNMMLDTVLTANKNNPSQSLEKIVMLEKSKEALNSIMKFINKS